MNKSIGIILQSISRSTGGTSSALDLSETLHDLKYDVYLFLTDQNPNEYRKKYKSKYPINIKNENIILAPSGINNLTISTKYLLKIILDYKIYYNHKNYYKYFYHEFISIFRKSIFTFKTKFTNSNFKSNDRLTKCDIIINIAGLNSFKLDELRKIYKGILIQNYAGDLINNYKKEEIKNTDFNFYNLGIEKYFKYFNFILFQSFDQSCFFDKIFYSINTKSLTLLPSTDEESILKITNSSSPYSNQYFNIVLIGTIQERKGQHLALEVLKGLVKFNKNIFLHIVGENVNNNYFIYLNNYITDNNLNSNVKFHGHRDDYLLYLAHSDIVLQTSLSEGVSRILRESMFLKKPIVTFSIPGTNSILVNNKSALLSKPFDTENMIKDVLLIIKDEKLKSEIINNSFKSYLINHKKEVYINNVIKIFNSIK